jgi:hypothetical protein
MSVITSKYRSDTARRFVDDVTFNDYYMFVSSTANTTVINSEKSKTEFLEKTIFGKKIGAQEVFYMIKNYPWEIDAVYDQYDDNLDMSNKKFYTVVYPVNNEVGDYRVYKCLFNNGGAKSLTPPNYSVSQQDQIYALADGYVWKYLFNISELEFDDYNTRGYIPIMSTESGNTAVQTSSISQIVITNSTNRGYEKSEGFVFQTATGTGEIIITASSGTLNAIENYYTGYTFYVTSVFGNDSRSYVVDTYTYDPASKRAVITLTEAPDYSVLTDSASYKLLPRIEIKGDGTGAVGLANVSANGSITSVTMLSKGSGYKNATAFVPDPFSFDPSSLNSLNERAILRPILSSPGGHASNLIDELMCRHILAYTTLTETDNFTIPATNNFTSIGIVKNPEFKNIANNDIFDNRIELALDNHSLAVNEIVTQIETDVNSSFYNEVIFSGKVHQVSNNFVYICEYMGPYPNSSSFANTDFSDISLNINLPIRSADDQILNINTDNDPEYPLEYDIDYPGFSISPYVQRTGEVYYMNSFFPITRTEESRERFKILLEF